MGSGRATAPYGVASAGLLLFDDARRNHRYSADAPPGAERIEDHHDAASGDEPPGGGGSGPRRLDPWQKPTSLEKVSSKVFSTDELKCELEQETAASVAESLGEPVSVRGPQGDRALLSSHLRARRSSSHVSIQDRSSITQVASTFGRVLDVTDIHAVLEQDVMLQNMLRDLRPTPLDGKEDADTASGGMSRSGLASKKWTRGWHVSAWLRATQQEGSGGPSHLCDKVLPMFHPNGRFRTWWNFAMAMLISYSGIAVPMQLAFYEDWNRVGWITLDYLVDFIFLVRASSPIQRRAATCSHVQGSLAPLAEPRLRTPR